MVFKSIAIAATILALSTSINASVINTLNGVDYEWLELTETQGMSRLDVESQLTDSNSALYGYEYASRQLVEDLLNSYAWYDIDSDHGDTENSDVIAGLGMYLDDFGRTFTNNAGIWSLGSYGLDDECGTNLSCISLVILRTDDNGTPYAAYQQLNAGWDALDDNPGTIIDYDSDDILGAHLVRISTIPIPAAVWLFGSGLIGLVGLARRKSRN